MSRIAVATPRPIVAVVMVCVLTSIFVQAQTFGGTKSASGVLLRVAPVGSQEGGPLLGSPRPPPWAMVSVCGRTTPTARTSLLLLAVHGGRRCGL